MRTESKSENRPTFVTYQTYSSWNKEKSEQNTVQCGGLEEIAAAATSEIEKHASLEFIRYFSKIFFSTVNRKNTDKKRWRLESNAASRGRSTEMAPPTTVEREMAGRGREGKFWAWHEVGSSPQASRNSPRPRSGRTRLERGVKL